MKNIFKIFFVFFFLISSLSYLVACSFQKSINASPALNDIANYLKDNIVFKDDLQKIEDSDILKNLYSNLNIDNISDFVLYTSASGATSEEIAIFKLKDPKHLDNVSSAIKKRIDDQINNFENYLPEEVYKLNSCVINNFNDSIITFVSCDTPNDVDLLLKKFYNNN